MTNPVVESYTIPHTRNFQIMNLDTAGRIALPYGRSIPYSNLDFELGRAHLEVDVAGTRETHDFDYLVLYTNYEGRVKVDNQSRILIPRGVRDLLKLSDKVALVVGGDGVLEIWDYNNWKQYKDLYSKYKRKGE